MGFSFAIMAREGTGRMLLSLTLENHAVSALKEPPAKGDCAQKQNVTMESN